LSNILIKLIKICLKRNRREKLKVMTLSVAQLPKYQNKPKYPYLKIAPIFAIGYILMINDSLIKKKTHSYTGSQ